MNNRTPHLEDQGNKYNFSIGMSDVCELQMEDPKLWCEINHIITDSRHWPPILVEMDLDDGLVFKYVSRGLQGPNAG